MGNININKNTGDLSSERQEMLYNIRSMQYIPRKCVVNTPLKDLFLSCYRRRQLLLDLIALVPSITYPICTVMRIYIVWS